MKPRYPLHNQLGLLSLLIFAGIQAHGIHWDALVKLQASRDFKVISGIFLTLYLALQWTLAYARRKKFRSLAEHLRFLHLYAGIIGPFLFYLHSTDLGFAYTWILSIVYLLDHLIGLLAPASIGLRNRHYVNFWFITHMLASTLVVILTACHVTIIAAYS